MACDDNTMCDERRSTTRLLRISLHRFGWCSCMMKASHNPAGMTVDKTWIRAGRKLQYKQPDECQRHGPMNMVWCVFVQGWSMQIEAFVCVCVLHWATPSRLEESTAKRFQQVIQGKTPLQSWIPVGFRSNVFSTLPVSSRRSPRSAITETLPKICWGLLTSWICPIINISHELSKARGFRLLIFSSSQKASNYVGWRAHTERDAVMNGVFTQVFFKCECMFTFILHIICPITVTSAINSPQSYFRQNHEGLTLWAPVWTAMWCEEKQRERKKSAVFSALENKL